MCPAVEEVDSFLPGISILPDGVCFILTWYQKDARGTRLPVRAIRVSLIGNQDNPKLRPQNHVLVYESMVELDEKDTLYR